MKNQVGVLSAKQLAAISSLTVGMRKGAVADLIQQVERHVRTFRSVLQSAARRPAVEAYARTARLTFYAEALHRDLKSADPVTAKSLRQFLRRLDWEKGGSPPRKRGNRRFERAVSASSWMASAGEHAQRRTSEAVFAGKEDVDVRFRQFAVGIAYDWQKAVGEGLPDVEFGRETNADGSYAPGPRMTAKQHPLWVILDALGIDIDPYTLDEIVLASRSTAASQLREEEWRSCESGLKGRRSPNA